MGVRWVDDGFGVCGTGNVNEVLLADFGGFLEKAGRKLRMEVVERAGRK